MKSSNNPNKPAGIKRRAKDKPNYSMILNLAIFSIVLILASSQSDKYTTLVFLSLRFFQLFSDGYPSSKQPKRTINNGIIRFLVCLLLKTLEVF
jgi:hypothetical protein